MTRVDLDDIGGGETEGGGLYFLGLAFEGLGDNDRENVKRCPHQMLMLCHIHHVF
jgi:hypothetical protein